MDAFDASAYICADFDFLDVAGNEDGKKRNATVSDDSLSEDERELYGEGGGGGGGGRLPKQPRLESDDDDTMQDDLYTTDEEDSDDATLNSEDDMSAEKGRRIDEELRSKGRFAADRFVATNYEVYCEPVSEGFAFPVSVIYQVAERTGVAYPGGVRAARDIEEGEIVSMFGGRLVTDKPSHANFVLAQKTPITFYIDYSSELASWPNNQPGCGKAALAKYIPRNDARANCKEVRASARADARVQKLVLNVQVVATTAIAKDSFIYLPQQNK